VDWQLPFVHPAGAALAVSLAAVGAGVAENAAHPRARRARHAASAGAAVRATMTAAAAIRINFFTRILLERANGTPCHRHVDESDTGTSVGASEAGGIGGSGIGGNGGNGIPNNAAMNAATA